MSLLTPLVVCAKGSEEVDGAGGAVLGSYTYSWAVGVGVAVGSAVGVGTGVSVGGTGVGVAVGGSGVAVGGTGVAVGGTGTVTFTGPAKGPLPASLTACTCISNSSSPVRGVIERVVLLRPTPYCIGAQPESLLTRTCTS